MHNWLDFMNSMRLKWLCNNTCSPQISLTKMSNDLSTRPFNFNKPKTSFTRGTFFIGPESRQLIPNNLTNASQRFENAAGGKWIFGAMKEPKESQRRFVFFYFVGFALALFCLWLVLLVLSLSSIFACEEDVIRKSCCIWLILIPIRWTLHLLGSLAWWFFWRFLSTGMFWIVHVSVLCVLVLQLKHCYRVMCFWQCLWDGWYVIFVGVCWLLFAGCCKRFYFLRVPNGCVWYRRSTVLAAGCLIYGMWSVATEHALIETFS